MRDMRTIAISKRSKFRILHIEAPGCIVNIHHGLHDEDGSEITRIDVQCDDYAGEPKVTLPDYQDRKHLAIRVKKAKAA